MPNTANSERDIAKRSLKSFRKLSKRFKNRQQPLELALPEDGTSIHIPLSALDGIEAILKNVAEGRQSEILSESEYLTAQQVADYLDTTRSFILRLMDEGKLPFIEVGGRRKVLFSALKEYDKRQQQLALDIMKEITAESQRLNLY